MKKRISTVLTAAAILFSSAAAYADTGVITADALNVRQKPNSTVIGQLTYGQNVTVVGYENGWCQIQYGDKTGYIFGNYVSITPQDATAETILPAEGQSTESQIPQAKTAGENILEYAKNFIGTPYVYGGTTPSGFDCSGFVKYVYSYFGVSLPRTSYAQMQSGYAVSTDELKVGDLLFFRGGGHVGIYAGNNTYIHSPNTGRTVSIDAINRTITAARRIF